MSQVLTINGGSSSIRLAIFETGRPPLKVLDGKLERIGAADAALAVTRRGGGAPLRVKAQVSDHGSAIEFLMDWLESEALLPGICAVGHRVVHGMLHTAPERVTPALLAELKSIVPYDPEHLPREIALIESLQSRHPQMPQVACFDTAFHRSMPRVATQLPIPRRFESKGVQRYGFHGLSYTFLIEELARLGDAAASEGRVILAHLGSGASIAAVRNGKSVDTSMGFTPAAGLVMSTRTGDLDPGLMSYLASSEGMDAARFQAMVNHESGMLGISETGSDVRDLLAREPYDARAAEAIALFCYQAKKWLGSYAAVLGGLDTLVFAGGIGEHAAPVRARICEGLQFLGIQIDDARNNGNAPLISPDAGAVAVRVMRTDEEIVIAKECIRLLQL